MLHGRRIIKEGGKIRTNSPVDEFLKSSFYKFFKSKSLSDVEKLVNFVEKINDPNYAFRPIYNTCSGKLLIGRTFTKTPSTKINDLGLAVKNEEIGKIDEKSTQYCVESCYKDSYLVEDKGRYLKKFNSDETMINRFLVQSEIQGYKMASRLLEKEKMENSDEFMVIIKERILFVGSDELTAMIIGGALDNKDFELAENLTKIKKIKN